MCIAYRLFEYRYYLDFFSEFLERQHDPSVRAEGDDAEPVVTAHRLHQQLGEDLHAVDLRKAFVGAVRLSHAETGVDDADETGARSVRLPPTDRVVGARDRGRSVDRTQLQQHVHLQRSRGCTTILIG